jgi:hypothetical protein
LADFSAQIRVLKDRTNLMQPPRLFVLGMLAVLSPDGLAQYTYITNGGAITINRYTGIGGAVTIPTFINGLPVTSLENDAFENYTNLTSVTVPGSITNTGEYTFNDCRELTNIIFAGGITSLGEGLMSLCVSLPSVTIPATVTNIGSGAFSDCTALTSVYFQGNAPAVGSSAFQYATLYYLPNTTGWGPTFGGRPAYLWNPLIQATGGNFGVRTNQFGFNITGTPSIPIVVEACDNLAIPVWTPVQALTLTNGLFYFSEPKQTGSGRFYRIASQ